MKKSVALPFVVIALASIVAGCGATGNVATSSVATPAPTPSTPCTSPPGYTIQEVFPQNLGASVLQANLQGVVFAIGPSPQPGGVPSPLPTSWFFYVTYAQASGTPIPSYPTNIGYLATPVPVPGSTAGSTPTPLPTPSDTPSPSFTNYIYESATNGTFADAATYTVYLASTTCYPGIQESTFTTNVIDQPSATPSPAST